MSFFNNKQGVDDVALSNQIGILQGNVNSNTTSLAENTSQMKKMGNILAYGAVGNGVTDCASAINQCLAENGVAFIPYGTFIVGSPIIMNKYNHIYGIGEGSIIKPNNTMTGNIISLSSDHVLIEDIKIIGNTNNPNSLNAIADTDLNRSTVFEMSRINNVIIQNLTGNGIVLSGRGEDFVIGNLYVGYCTGNGINLTGISDSILINSQISSCNKIGLIPGSSMKVLGTKIYLCGSAGIQYPALQMINMVAIVINGCDFQQNVNDGILIDGGGGHFIDGCMFDSNNSTTLAGQGNFGQIKIQNGSMFNRINAVMVDGRCATGQAEPYNIAAMYGVVIADGKSCYNTFDITYSPYAYNQNFPRMIPFYTIVNDISSVYKFNNVDYFGYSSSKLVAGTNATLGGSASGTIPANNTSTNNGNQIDYVMSSSKSAVAGTDYLFERITLTSAQFNLTGKSTVYVTWQSKVIAGLDINITIGENSTTHTSIVETGQVNVTTKNQYFNNTWQYCAAYKPLSYSNEAGFTVYLDVTIGVDSNTSLTSSQIIASLKNIQVSFA